MAMSDSESVERSAYGEATEYADEQSRKEWVLDTAVLSETAVAVLSKKDRTEPFTFTREPFPLWRVALVDTSGERDYIVMVKDGDGDE